MAAGDYAGALACHTEALQIDPDFAEACANLGWLRERAGDMAEAEACYRRALRLDPDLAQVHLNLGALLIRGKRLPEAEQACLRALDLTPEAPAAWTNLGVVYACLQRDADAERCQRHALELDGDHVSAHVNLAYLLLRQGRYEEGWKSLDRRQWYPQLSGQLACPRWRGESLTGKRILVGYEAGQGDMIQFCRYAAVLKSLGAPQVDVLCHPSLAALFATLDGADAIYPFDQPCPASGWDYWSPPLSLPHYCGTRLESIPAAIPYLRVDPQRAARWQALLPTSGVRVGLVWKGSVNFENDADRSLASLSLLEPLRTVEGVAFVSLQKGAGEDEARRRATDWPLLELGSQVQDFADTAAIVAELDLVISVDTGVAHLAGALGKRCWLMLPDYKTDWRWLTGRDDSPWYPDAMRLFRQSAAGDWQGVAARMVDALRVFAVERAHQVVAAQAQGNGILR